MVYFNRLRVVTSKPDDRVFLLRNSIEIASICLSVAYAITRYLLTYQALIIDSTICFVATCKVGIADRIFLMKLVMSLDFCFSSSFMNI